MKRLVIWAVTVAAIILGVGLSTGTAKSKYNSQYAEWQGKDKGKPTILSGQVCIVRYADTNEAGYKMPAYTVAVPECRGVVDVYLIAESVPVKVEDSPTHRTTFVKWQRIRFYLKTARYFSYHGPRDYPGAEVKMIEPDQILEKLGPFDLYDMEKDVTVRYY